MAGETVKMKRKKGKTQGNKYVRIKAQKVVYMKTIIIIFMRWHITKNGFVSKGI